MESFGWSHAGASALAAFLAATVEFVEALTIVLAIGSVRGWRDALLGAAAAFGLLLLIVAVFGTALTRVPLDLLQASVGVLLLLFGLRWLRKAILRAARVIPLHDEAAAYAEQKETMRGRGAATGLDRVAFAAAFQITMLEGAEVVFIVIAIGAGGTDLLIPASIGALAALAVVVVLGAVIHKPLASVPENSLKFTVGVLLSAFGTFWVGEGMGVTWPGADWSILALVFGFLGAALLGARLCRAESMRRVVAGSAP